MIATESTTLCLLPARVAVPRPPHGPGDGDGDPELPVGDPPDTDETDDPNDEDEGEEDDVPLRGRRLLMHGRD